MAESFGLSNGRASNAARILTESSAVDCLQEFEGVGAIDHVGSLSGLDPIQNCVDHLRHF